VGHDVAGDARTSSGSRTRRSSAPPWSGGPVADRADAAAADIPAAMSRPRRSQHRLPASHVRRRGRPAWTARTRAVRATRGRWRAGSGSAAGPEPVAPGYLGRCRRASARAPVRPPAWLRSAAPRRPSRRRAERGSARCAVPMASEPSPHWPGMSESLNDRAGPGRRPRRRMPFVRTLASPG
jgi:hypothetical protein